MSTNHNCTYQELIYNIKAAAYFTKCSNNQQEEQHDALSRTFLLLQRKSGLPPGMDLSFWMQLIIWVTDN